MRSKGRWVTGLAMFVCLFSSVAWAGGLILYEVNSPSTGTASAGWAALAKDASTAFQNPAGMTRLDRSQLLVGAQPEIITSKFNSSPGTTTIGERGVNGGGVLPSMGGYYVYSASDRLKLGLSALSYFGLGLDYGDTWVGRYRVEKATFLTATLAPSLAYRINNWLSIGAMLNITSAYLKTETAVNNLRPELPDGQVSYKDSTTGVGGGFGLLIEPTESTRFGVTYYSPVSLNFNDTPSFSGLDPS